MLNFKKIAKKKKEKGNITPIKAKDDTKDNNKFLIKVNPFNYTEKKESRNKRIINSNRSEMKVKDKNNIISNNKNDYPKINCKRLFLDNNEPHHISSSNSRKKYDINTMNINNNPIKNKNTSFINIKVTNDREKTIDNNSQRKNRLDKIHDNNLFVNKTIDNNNSTNHNIHKEYNKRTYHKNININLNTNKIYNNLKVNRSVNREELLSNVNQNKIITENNNCYNLSTQNKYNFKLKKREIMNKKNGNEKYENKDINKIKDTNKENKEISNNNNRPQKNYIHRKEVDTAKTFLNSNRSSIILQKKNGLNRFKSYKTDIRNKVFNDANNNNNKDNNNKNVDNNHINRYYRENRNNHRYYVSTSKGDNNNSKKDINQVTNSLSCNRTYTNFNRQLGLKTKNVDKNGNNNKNYNLTASNNFESCYNLHPSYKKRNIILPSNNNSKNNNNQRITNCLSITNNGKDSKDNKDNKETINQGKYISNERLVRKGIIDDSQSIANSQFNNKAKKIIKDTNTYDNDNKFKYLAKNYIKSEYNKIDNDNNNNDNNQFNQTQNFYYKYKLNTKNLNASQNKLSSNSVTFKNDDKSIEKRSLIKINKILDNKQNNSTILNNKNNNNNLVYNKINPKNYCHISNSNSNRMQFKPIIKNRMIKLEQDLLKNKKDEKRGNTLSKNDNKSFNEMMIKRNEIKSNNSNSDTSQQYLSYSSTRENLGKRIKKIKKPENPEKSEKTEKLERLTVNRIDGNFSEKVKKIPTGKMEKKNKNLFQNNYFDINKNGIN